MKDTLSKSSKKLLSTGDYEVRCISVMGLGTLPNTFNPTYDPKNTIRFTFETVNKYDKFSKEDKLEPYVASIDFNRYLSKTSKLGKFLTAWKPGCLPATEDQAMDYKQFIGFSGIMTIVQKPKAKDPTQKKQEIVSVTEYKGQPLKAAYNPLILFELGSHNCMYLEKQGVGKPEVMTWYTMFGYLKLWQQKELVTALEWNDLCAREKVRVQLASDWKGQTQVWHNGQPLFDSGVSEQDMEMSDPDGGFGQDPDENLPF